MLLDNLTDWLENSSSTPVVLVDATVRNVTTQQEVHLYFSNKPYRTSDDIAIFNDIINNDVVLTESISEADSEISFGDIELLNYSAEFDALLDGTKYIWVNRPIVIYYGDSSWSSSYADLETNFVVIFKGNITGIDSKSVNTVNIKFTDKLEKLNYPISESKLGPYGTWGGTTASGTKQNEETSRPIIFGEVFNTAPLLIDPVADDGYALQYMFNCTNTNINSGILENGESEAILEIRDNGLKIYPE